MRLGLCCLFRDQPIKFVTTTATSIGKMKRPDALAKLSRLCMKNADALLAALRFCADNGIGCFRINSQILPIKTHPACGYEIDDLPESDAIVRRFQECGQFVHKHKLLTESKMGTCWFVYLLRCADGSLYTGITNDVPRRLKQHNAGTASRYTRSRLPVVLVYHEAQASHSHALKRELAIKALSRQEKESMIRAAGPAEQRLSH
jgi:predicted GIY-YIG superfamily endonuclease